MSAWSLTGRRRGRPRPRRTPGTASRVGASIMLSCRLAPDSVAPSGVPSRSTTRCRFDSGLPRSVGFGPICDPPFWPQRSHCRASSGSSRGVQHRPAVPEARGAADPRPRPPASRASAASTSCPSNRSRRAASPTECRTAEQTRSRPVRPDRRGAGARPSVETAAVATGAQSTPTTHRKRELSPSPINAPNAVLLGALRVVDGATLALLCDLRRELPSLPP